MKMRAWALLPLLFVVAACGSSGSGQPASAAVVNGHQISMEAYTAEFRQQRQSSIDTVGYDVCSIPSMKGLCAIIKKRSLNNVIDAELVREYANRHGIAVSPTQDALVWKQTFQRKFDNRRDVENIWLRRVGITEPDLRRGLHQDLLEQKVIYAVTAGLSSYQPSIDLAQIEVSDQKDLKQVQAYLKRHIPFTSVAALTLRQNVPGCTAGQCGVLGWTPDAFVPPNRKQLLSAPVGSVVGPIRQQLDWLLFQVEGRSAHVKLTARQLYQLRQLKFVAWIERQQKLAQVKEYVAV